MTASATSPLPNFFTTNRNVVIASSVLVFHALAIWALQTGLIMRAVEVIVPIEVLAQIIDLPTPKVTPQPPAPPEPVKQVAPKPKQVTQAAPTLLAVPDAVLTPNAPSVQPIAPPAPYTPAVPVAAVATPAPPAPVKVQRLSSEADYLSNPKPRYPFLSRKMGEQGRVMLLVDIDSNGVPKKVELMKSSGYERLDQAALGVIMTWRFVPQKQNGVVVPMLLAIPIDFSLEQ